MKARPIIEDIVISPCVTGNCNVIVASLLHFKLLTKYSLRAGIEDRFASDRGHVRCNTRSALHHTHLFTTAEEAPAQINTAAESEAGVGGDTACGGVPVTIETIEAPAQTNTAAESEAIEHDSIN